MTRQEKHCNIFSTIFANKGWQKETEQMRRMSPVQSPFDVSIYFF